MTTGGILDRSTPRRNIAGGDDDVIGGATMLFLLGPGSAILDSRDDRVPGRGGGAVADPVRVTESASNVC
jgi:hypothetical protein